MESIIATLGAGSGIDMAALTKQLVEAQFAAKTARLDSRDTKLDRQISAASSIRNKIQTLASALGDRVRSGDLAPSPTISNSAVAGVSRLSTDAARSGTYSLEVKALARGQSLASTAFAGADSVIGSGSLTIRFGDAGGASFVEDSGHTPVIVNIASGATLADIADAITGSGSGVTAYVAATTTGARLVMKGADGTLNGFTVEASETPGEEGLAALAWTPGSTSTSQLLATAGNALVAIDGLDVESAGNTLNTAIEGISLSLTATNIGNPARIGFSNPTANISDVMSDLVAAFNEIHAELAVAMDSQTGDIRQDSGAQALRRQLSQLSSKIIMPGALDGEPQTLSQLGLRTNRDGSFALDIAILNAVLADQPEAAAAMFTNGLYGVFAEVDRIARSSSVAGDPGSLAASIQRYTRLKTVVVDDRAKIEESSERLRARLTQQFSVADTRVAGFQSTMSFLENQIAAWNGSAR